MGKIVFAFMLITNLLICPFRCLSSDGGTAVDDGGALLTCACCPSHNNSDDSPSKDDEPEDDCSCPNCICEGATLQDGTKVSAVDIQIAIACWLIPVDISTECEVDTYPSRVKDRKPLNAGGRTARIVFQV